MENKLSKPCWTCRNRHVQCDQTRMPCAKCTKVGLECSEKRPVRWVQGVAIRGKMQGHMYACPADKPVATSSKRSGKIVFKTHAARPSTRGNAVVPKSNRSLLKSSIRKRRNTDNNGAVLTGSTVLDPDHGSKYYLDYYLEHMCKDFVFSETDRNMLRDLVPFSLNDSALQKSLIALAARHLANRGQSFRQADPNASEDNTEANRKALVFKQQAMQALLKTLSDPVELDNDRTRASIFLFILLDLMESGSSGWDSHLEGAKRLLYLNQPTSKVADRALAEQNPWSVCQDLQGFLMRQLYLVESLGSLFARPGRATSLPQAITFDEHSITYGSINDSFLGCPAFLLRAIRFISTERDLLMAKLQDIGLGAKETDKRSLEEMLSLVETFDCDRSPFDIPKEFSSSPQNQDETHHRSVLSKAYRIGILIYGKRVLEPLTEGRTSGVAELVSELLNLLDTLRGDQNLLRCVLWPLFVAGLECQSPQQRKYFLMHLEKFWMATKCLNVIHAARILEDYWKEGGGSSISWPFDSGRFGRVWLFM
ncbi:unnamed protein product [Clonostachys chloroleuca]|uniref:Zn(2)-C6 fungal-type domain-containing protein n=1 Tax=Clonostachys chloroleuca TaxID=1926264 RepID=A0AA35Q542_9HYPO|nr:unnamed protein product [Clonostachys chloroleuca]